MSSTSRNLRTLTLSNASTVGRPPFPSGPPSPTLTATTNASQLNLGAASLETVITRRNLRESLAAYESLVTDSRAYRESLSAMAAASARFAGTIERCSRLKGVDDEASVGLQSAAGLHHLMANHWEVLGDSLFSSFEKPLRIELENYRRTVSERTTRYDASVVEKSRAIKQTEKENMNPKRRIQRDLQSFRATLSILQAQVDDLDQLKSNHYQEILEHEHETWDSVYEKVAVVVRSSLEVFDRLTAKSSDPSFESVVQAIPDPFNTYGPPKAEGQLFSILTPLGIGPTASSNVHLPPFPSGLAFAFGGKAPASLGYLPPSLPRWGESSDEGSQSDWSDARSPPHSPTSPPAAKTSRKQKLPVSPPSSSTSRRGASPPSMRRAETKLRSVLSAVEEAAAPSLNGYHQDRDRATERNTWQESTAINFPSGNPGSEEKISESRSTTPTPGPQSAPDPEPRFFALATDDNTRRDASA